MEPRPCSRATKRRDFQEEIFGPGALGHDLEDEDEALAIANSALWPWVRVWTRDINCAYRMGPRHPGGAGVTDL